MHENAWVQLSHNTFSNSAWKFNRDESVNRRTVTNLGQRKKKEHKSTFCCFTLLSSKFLFSSPVHVQPFFSFPEHFCKQEQTADNCCKHALTGRLRNIADILAAICVNTWYLTAIRILGFFRHQWVLISCTHHLLQSKQMIIIYLFTCFQGRDVSEEGGGRLKKKRGFELCLGTWTTGQHVVSVGVHDFHFFPFQWKIMKTTDN